MPYHLTPKTLQAYANVLINFGLGGGTGLKPGKTVLIQIPESAKPLYAPLRDTVLRAGGYPIMQYLAEGVDEAGMYNIATPDQLAFFPDKYYRGLVDQIDYRVYIIADADLYELANVDPANIMAKANAVKPYREWLDAKEAAGNYTWTLGMYGTPAMAEAAGMSEEEYWAEIIKACYLDRADPVGEWKALQKELDRIRGALNDLKIDSLHVEGEHIDLVVGLGEGRQWLGGRGANIPSFELFISPDCRRTEGHIAFNQPLYRYGNKIEGIELTFKNGTVTEATATTNQGLLRQMIASENADRIGEFSLTDSRHSPISRPMAETLFDENMGGPEGNTHIALGNAYQDSYPGNAGALSVAEWEALGYNRSPVHTDIISTERRRVTATLPAGKTQVIYENGRFLI